MGVLKVSGMLNMTPGLMLTYDAYVSLGRIEEFLLLENLLEASESGESNEPPQKAKSTSSNQSRSYLRKEEGNIRNVSLSREATELGPTILCVSSLSCAKTHREDEFILQDITFKEFNSHHWPGWKWEVYSSLSDHWWNFERQWDDWLRRCYRLLASDCLGVLGNDKRKHSVWPALRGVLVQKNNRRLCSERRLSAVTWWWPNSFWRTQRGSEWRTTGESKFSSCNLCWWRYLSIGWSTECCWF